MKMSALKKSIRKEKVEKQMLIFGLPVPLKEKLEKFAKDNNTSMSAVVIAVISEFLKEAS